MDACTVLLYEVELLAYWFPDWPVREALGVTQVSEVVNVAEELILQLGVWWWCEACEEC